MGPTITPLSPRDPALGSKQANAAFNRTLDDTEHPSSDLLKPTPDPKVVYRDNEILVLAKPARMYVHPPESRFAKQRLTGITCIKWIEKNLELKANPIHRLDFATEGLVIFGLTPESTRTLNILMRERGFEKKYPAVVRGWFREPHGIINRPLELDSTGELVPCQTNYQTLKTIELPFSVNSKFSTVRYSLLELDLITGRWHQIRRHMNREAHPILGDREHGDSHHNRFFREHFGLDGLCLKANTITFPHPAKNEIMSFTAPVSEDWQKIYEIFDFPRIQARYSESVFSNPIGG